MCLCLCFTSVCVCLFVCLCLFVFVFVFTSWSFFFNSFHYPSIILNIKVLLRSSMDYFYHRWGEVGCSPNLFNLIQHRIDNVVGSSLATQFYLPLHHDDVAFLSLFYLLFSGNFSNDISYLAPSFIAFQWSTSLATSVHLDTILEIICKRSCYSISFFLAHLNFGTLFYSLGLRMSIISDLLNSPVMALFFRFLIFSLPFLFLLTNI